MGKGILSLVSAAGTSGDETVSPETILFNELEITNVNFFADSSSDSFASKLKTNIASWYYVMRTIAIIASVCVLLYIGIRMATSTIASEEAEYKRMLTDWLVGFALIFLLHYIIILVINGNDVIVRALKTTMESSSGQLTSFLDKISDQIGWAQEISKTLSATFVYLILVGITLAFLLMYIKRMIVVAFLIIIAPLITITYAIDKVKDKESQALNSWIKEFFWTVLIQPFHCVIYVVFVSVAVSSLDEATLSSAILAIMCMIFILQAEDIIKKIFGIQADNIGKMSSSFAVAAGALDPDAFCQCCSIVLFQSGRYCHVCIYNTVPDLCRPPLVVREKEAYVRTCGIRGRLQLEPKAASGIHGASLRNRRYGWTDPVDEPCPDRDP